MYKYFMKIRNFENLRKIDFFYKSAFIFLKIPFYVVDVLIDFLISLKKRKLVFTFFLKQFSNSEKGFLFYIFRTLCEIHTNFLWNFFIFKKFPYICKFSLAFFFLRETLVCSFVYFSTALRLFFFLFSILIIRTLLLSPSVSASFRCNS